MKRTIKDFDLKGKRVLIRCDFNVPIKEGKIIDDNRIKESLQTINYAIEQGAKVIIFAHLGRVKEEADLAKNDMRMVAERLSTLLGKEIKFSHKTRGKELEEAVANLQEQEVLLVQNTRYEDLEGKKESKNDPELATYWASLGDIYINDAFGTAHRAHASNVGLASKLPSGVGFLMEKELDAFRILENPDRPYTLILGGAKVSDKIGIIEHLAPMVDHILIGGGMAFTFLKANGKEIGKSLLEEESVSFCKDMLTKYASKIVLPTDFDVTTEFTEEASNHIASIDQINPTEMGMDIGPQTIDQFNQILSNSKTILWNGPLGVYEMTKYQTGTKKTLENAVLSQAKVILGGGDIVAAASELGYKDKVTHASTGGGAMLEYLEGKELPGLQAIPEKE